jgi:hypothetical protein
MVLDTRNVQKPVEHALENLLQRAENATTRERTCLLAPMIELISIFMAYGV